MSYKAYTNVHYVLNREDDENGEAEYYFLLNQQGSDVQPVSNMPPLNPASVSVFGASNSPPVQMMMSKDERIRRANARQMGSGLADMYSQRSKHMMGRETWMGGRKGPRVPSKAEIAARAEARAQRVHEAEQKAKNAKPSLKRSVGTRESNKEWEKRQHQTIDA